MQLKRSIATVLSTLSLLISGGALAASPATAVGGCPSNRLCLYNTKNFTHLNVTSASTNSCFVLKTFGLTSTGSTRAGIVSWVNNLPVKATLYFYTGSVFYSEGALGAHSFSSDTTVSSNDYWYFNSTQICMGTEQPVPDWA